MKRLSVIFFVFVFATLLVAGAKADTLQFVCSDPSACTTGTTTGTVLFQAPVSLNLVSNGSKTLSGNAFMAVLVPDSTMVPAISFSGSYLSSADVISPYNSGDLGSFLNIDFNGYNFGSFQADSEEASVTPSYYSVYVYGLGSFSSSHSADGLTSDINLGWIPAGTVVEGWVEDSSGGLLAETHTGVALPEAPSIVLLGLGLIGLACMGLLRQRHVTA